MPQETGDKFKRIVWPLAVAQTLLWAGAFYLFPSLLRTWESELGWTKTELAGAFTLALLLSALLAPLVGRQIDYGRSRVLFPVATLTAAILLGLLSTVQALWQFYLVWAVLGVVMAGSLYEPCFAIITRHLGGRARQAITLVTLLAGFAGTFAFPTSHALVEVIGWRGVTLVFAGLIAFVAAPLNLYAISNAETANPAPVEPPAPNTGKTIDAASLPTFLLLAFSFAAIAFDHGALIAHLLPLFSERGVHGEVAILAAAMIGPMQVTGRLAMMAFETKIATISVAAASVLAMALASAALFGVKYEPMLLVVFVLFQGAGFGVASIVRPLLIAELLGRRKFGTIAGLLAVPFLVALALAPSVAGYIWTLGGYDALIAITVCVSISGGCALLVAARTATRIWDGIES